MSSAPVAQTKSRRLLLRQVHRISAIIVGIYALPHVLNHLLALDSPERHIAAMALFRQAYRHPVVEALLLTAVLTQILTGSLQLWSMRGQKVAIFTRLQRWAGLILAIFLTQHVSAVLFGRLVQGLDTNFYFAAAVLLKFPLLLYFAPYYIGGTAALFVHLGAALRPTLARKLGRQRADQAAWVITGLGLAIGLAIVVALSGLLYPIQLPAGYSLA